MKMTLQVSRQNQQRNLIQSRAVMSAQSFNHLVLEWSTGCGKTLASIKIIDKILIDNPNATGYIICKESTHRKNWIEDIKKHGYEHILDSIDILLYASAKKIEANKEFLVLDECHALSPKRMGIIRDKVDFKTKVLYLSATINDDKRYLISMISRYTEKYYRISLLEAIKLGLLPSPEVVIHRKKLVNDNNRIYEFLMSKGRNASSHKETCDFNERWDVFNRASVISLSVMCNEKEYYSLITDQMNYYKDQSEKGKLEMRTVYKNRFLNLGSKRKKFLASAKTEKARKLVKQFRASEERFICFTGSIAQSKELGSHSSIHSKNEKGKNQELIDCFNREECNELFAVKMLRESVNLTNTQKGIIVQLDSTIGSFYQMLGRCLRSSFPQMHLLVIEDTQDEVYFASAMEDFDKKYIRDE